MSGFERSPAYRQAQIQRSRRSPHRSKPGTQDHGQRYVIRYHDGTGQRRDFGFTDSADEAARWLREVQAHPVWTRGKIVDRKAAR